METTHPAAPAILSTTAARFFLSDAYAEPVWIHRGARGFVQVWTPAGALKAMMKRSSGQITVAGDVHDLTGDDAAEVLASLLEVVAAPPVHEWDVRDGKVYRNGQALVSFSEYRDAHPDSDLTVEQWEDRKWRQVGALATSLQVSK